jgi:Spy/CpxP family protein refolding chaperone
MKCRQQTLDDSRGEKLNKQITLARRMLLAVSMTATCFLATVSQAQSFIKIAGPDSAEKYMTLGRADVQDELKLTNAQKAEVNDLVKQFNAAMREFPNLEMAANAEEANEIIQSHQNKIQKKFDPLVTKALNDDQNKRLNQVTLQLASPDILLSEKIAKELKLTDDQKSKMQGLIDTMLEMVMELQPPIVVIQGETPPPMPKQNPEVPKMFAKAKQQCLKLLNKEQSELWKQLIGPEFKVKEEK